MKGLIALLLFAGAGIDAHAATPAACPSSVFIAQNGVAFSSFPSSAHLVRTITVGPGTVKCWKAHSNVAWLSTSTSAKSSFALILSASTTGLSPDTLYQGTVTVTPVGGGTASTIQVGLWIGSTDPPTVTVAHSAVSLVANPSAPYVYVSDGTAQIDVFNVYTGALVTSYPKLAAGLQQLAISSDGAQLFAAVPGSQEIIAIATSTGSVIKRYGLASAVPSDFSFAYARPAGNGTLLAPGQSAIDVATGSLVSAPISATNGFFDPLISATPDGTQLFILQRANTPGTLLTYSVTAAGALTITETGGSALAGGNCQALANTISGAQLYPACGSPYQFDVYNDQLVQIQSLAALPYPNNAFIDSDGDFVGGIDGIGQSEDIFVYHSNGHRAGSLSTLSAGFNNGQQNNALAVSGDSVRVVTVTSSSVSTAQQLMFRTLP